MGENKKVARAATVITFSFGFSKILGFVRDAALGYFFGASASTDAFLVASSIPEIIRHFFAGGAVEAGLIPVLSGYSSRNDMKSFFITANTVGFLLISILAVLSIGGIFLSDNLVGLVAPGFHAEKALLTSGLVRIMMPSMIFLSTSCLMSAVLNSYKHFFTPSITQGVMNFFNIICMFLLVKQGIYSAAVGILIGSFTQILIQLPVLIGKKYRFISSLSLRQEGVKKFFILILPLIFGISVNQIQIVINRVLASSLGEGSISALDFASRIKTIPEMLFGLSVSVAIFPTLSAFSAEGRKAEFSNTLFKFIKAAFILLIPCTFWCMLLKNEIIGLLFQRGAFTTEATVMTASALYYYMTGAFAAAISYILIKACYAEHDTKTPVRIGIIAIAVNIALNLALIGPMSYRGLALATSMASVLQMLLLLRKFTTIGTALAFLRDTDTLKIAASGLLSFGATAFCHSLLSGLPFPGLLLKQLCVLAGTFATAYGLMFLLMFLFKVKHIEKVNIFIK